MNFENDILIAYTQKDDELLKGGEKGWVTNFERFLRTLTTQISDKQFHLKSISDEALTTTDLENAGIVLLILSPTATRNESFVSTVRSYISNLERNDNLMIEGHSRVFKVIKFPEDVDEFLPELEDILPYDFYHIDPLTGEPQIYERFFGSDAERGYWLKMVDMAYDINQVLMKANNELSAEEITEIERDKTVYLASSGVDMVIQRDIIKRELLRHGYRVLPEHNLPKEVSSLDKMVREDLAKCRLSIHLIGEDYGYKPKGSDLSVVDIQNRIADEHLKEIISSRQKSDDSIKFSRLVWLSPDLKNVSERQKIFIEDLKSDAASHDEAEVLQITLQEFKSIIREELVTGGRFKTHESDYKIDRKDDENLIYLICDKLDLDGSKPLMSYLEDKGFGVVSPIYEGDLADIRYVHQENLRRCDASIIYYGRASEDWIKTKLQDLLKAPGFGRVKPYKVKAVYLEGQKPELDLKQFQKNNAMVLGNNGGFKPEHIEPFLDKLVK